MFINLCHANTIFVSYLQTDIATFSHTWRGLCKPVNSMWMRTSPEVEMALCILCNHYHPNSVCNTRIDNYDVPIQTFTWVSDPPMPCPQLATCYTVCP